jgi:anti-anti-sigma factor
MSAVTFIDATTIGALIAIRNDANRGNNTVIIGGPSRCVRRILELTALTQAFTTEAQRE